MPEITMLGTGLIGMFYTQTLHGQRGRDKVHTVYSRTAERAQQFAADWDIPNWTTDMNEAIQDAETDVVVIGLPNHLHKPAALLSAQSGKAVLCTKPLARNAAEAKEMLDAVEAACCAVESDPEVDSVGFGGLPDAIVQEIVFGQHGGGREPGREQRVSKTLGRSHSSSTQGRRYRPRRWLLHRAAGCRQRPAACARQGRCPLGA